MQDIDSERAMAGFLIRQRLDRPHVTLKLALSIDGCIATASGESKWITGPAARAHTHLERARADAILVGRGTYEADAPGLNVRLPGLEDRSPARYVLTTKSVRPEPVEGQSAREQLGQEDRASTGSALTEWGVVHSMEAVATLPANTLLVEGGAQTAASFLAADLIDRLLIYRAPIVIGGGNPGIADIGLTDLTTAHNRWTQTDTRSFGPDRLDIYERVRD